MQHSTGGLCLGLLLTFGVGVTACGHDAFVPGRLCAAGTTRPCYTGDEGKSSGQKPTEGVGVCHAGVETCRADETGWGACEGEVTPGTETCLPDKDDPQSEPQDEDCDGEVNEDGEGCECLPGAMEACYTGPQGTEGIGICAAGARACAPSGTWSECMGDVRPEVEDCDNQEDDDCDGVVCAGPLWAELFAGSDEESVGAITADANGNAVVVGEFGGAIDFGDGALQSAGKSDAFVVKLDAQGKKMWAARFGGLLPDGAAAVAVDPSGDVLVAGSYASDPFEVGSFVLHTSDINAFVAKFDGASGAVLWALQLGAAGIEEATTIATDKDGNVAVGGSFNGKLVCNLMYPTCINTNGGLDGFVVRVLPDGTVAWFTTFGGVVGDQVLGVAFDNAGNLLATGTFALSAKWGNITLSTSGGSDEDFFLAKLDASGAPIWAKDFGDAATQEATGVAVDATGNAYLIGHTTGTVPFANSSFGGVGDQAFVAKVSAGGNAIWGRTFTNEGEANSTAFPAAVSIDAAGQLAVAGSFSGKIDFGGGPRSAIGTADGFLTKLDASGASLWAKSFGAATFTNAARGVAFTPAGHVLLGVTASGTIDLGLGDMGPQTKSNAGAAEYAP